MGERKLLFEDVNTGVEAPDRALTAQPYGPRDLRWGLRGLQSHAP